LGVTFFETQCILVASLYAPAVYMYNCSNQYYVQIDRSMHLRIWLLSALLAVVYDNTVQQMVGYFTARTPIPMVIAAAMLLDLIVSK